MQERWIFFRGIEESYLKQKSRINWLKEWDQNTAYFHKIAIARSVCNAIRSLISSMADPDGINDIAITHFKDILALTALAPLSLLFTGYGKCKTSVVLWLNKM